MSDKIIELPKNVLDTLSKAILPNKHEDNIILKKIENEKKIIICIHKDISKKKIDVLFSYGKVLFFEDCYTNIEPSILIFDYLIIDLRKDTHRNYYKLYLYNKSEYYYILYRHWFESNNGCIYNNEITEFPSQQSCKKNYDNILLLPNIYEPKWYISLFRFCCIKG